MEGLLAADDAALTGLEEANLEIEAEVDHLRGRNDIVYGDPPISRAEGHSRLELIEREAQGAFDGLLRQGSAFRERARTRSSMSGVAES